MELEEFERLFREFQNPVYGWIVRIVRNPALAEELTVETFWRVWRSRDSYDSTRPFGAWARRIATNVALDSLRHSCPEVALRGTPPAADSSVPQVQELSSKVLAALESLPAKLRAVAILSLIEEVPQAEIADGLGAPLGTVKTRLRRAIQLLRKKLVQLGVKP